MLGARRGRFFRDGQEIHDVVGAMREMTEGTKCYVCKENDAGAALLITRRVDEEQEAPVVPICPECMGGEEKLAHLHEKLDRELSSGELSVLPSIHVKPALIIRTDKPSVVVESAMKELGDAVVQDGSHFEIVEKDHLYFYKPDGQTSIHFFRDSKFVMQVTQNAQMVDGIEFFDRSPWDDMEELMYIIHRSPDFAKETAPDPTDKEDMACRETTSSRMVDWLQELVWWRVQRAIEAQQRKQKMSSLARAMPPELINMLGAITGQRDDCDCEICTAARAAAAADGEEVEGPPQGETIH